MFYRRLDFDHAPRRRMCSIPAIRTAVLSKLRRMGSQYEADDQAACQSRGVTRADVVLVGHGGQAGEHVAQVGGGVFAVTQGGDDDRVEDSRAAAGFEVADKQPRPPLKGAGFGAVIYR